MALEVRIITGPSSARISKEAAAKKLAEHPEFPEGATFELEEVEGRWVAAIASEKVAEFPPKSEDEGSEGPAEEAPEAPAEGPADDAPAEGGEEKPEGDDKGGDKPKGEHDKKGGELDQVLHLLTTLCTALGIDPLGADASPVPGLDEGPAAPVPGEVPAPHGHDGPPAGEGLGNDNKTHTVHERALKPGEAPPGTTPIGSPAFASVGDDHPWKNVLGQKRTFKVEEPIGDAKLADVKAELDALADGTGYKVAQLREAEVNGQRIARALISR